MTGPPWPTWFTPYGAGVPSGGSPRSGRGKRSGAHHVRGRGTVRSPPRSGKGNGPELTETLPHARDRRFGLHPPAYSRGTEKCARAGRPTPCPLSLAAGRRPPQSGKEPKLEVKITSPQGIVPAPGWIVSAGLRRKSQWRGRPGFVGPLSVPHPRHPRSSHQSERRKGPGREGTGLDPSDEVPGPGSLSRRLVRPGRGGPGGVGHGGQECPW